MKSQFEDIWNRIEQEKIQPFPRWVIILRRIAIWAGFALSVLLGAVTLAYFVFLMQNLNADLLIEKSPWELLSIAPLAWLITFLAFLGLAFWSVEHTESGYKVHFSLWILGNICLTVITSLLLVALEVPRTIEPGIHALMPPFSATRMEEKVWHAIQGGRIQGEISEITDNSFTIKDFNEANWTVLLFPKTKIELKLEPDIHVRVIGKPTLNNTTEADLIIPVKKPLKRVPMREIRGNKQPAFH